MLRGAARSRLSGVPRLVYTLGVELYRFHGAAMATLLDVGAKPLDFLSRRLPVWALISFVTLLVLTIIRPPVMPTDGQEASWALASEYAFRHHLEYGTQFIFTYGPFAFLSTRLFQPSTFPFVIVGDVLLGLVYLSPLIIVRELWLFILYAISGFVGFFPAEAAVSAAAFALFGLTLAYRSFFVIIIVAIFAVSALSKYSFLLVILPLLVVSDLYHLTRGRYFPAFVVAFLTTFILLLEMVSHFTLDWPQFLLNTADIIAYYSRAMQYGGTVLKIGLYAGAAVIVGAAGFAFAYPRDRDQPITKGRPAVAAGTLWYIFIIFKMGYVRQDDHIIDSWHGLIFGFIVLVALLRMLGLFHAESFARATGAICVLLGLVVCSAALVDMRQTVGDAGLTRVPAYISSRLQQVADGERSGVEWLYPARWRSAIGERNAADAALKRTFPESVTGTVDLIPGDVAPLIASGLRYDPRPVLESYSSYSPRLQQLDSAFFEGASAPHTLFLDISDIDGRLPTQATGPSLPVIGRWYDAVDLDPLGLVLRRRTEPRPMEDTNLGQADIKLGQWVTLPDYGRGLLFATFRWPRSLLGKVLAFAFREPILAITLKSASGDEYTYRLVPSMTEAGIVLAPLPLGDSRLAALDLLDPAISEARSKHIAEFRVSGGHLARLTYPLAHVSFAKLALAPGFSGTNAALSATNPFLSLIRGLFDTASAEQITKGAVWVRGHDLFAHAPATLSAELAGPTVFQGSIGFRDDPLVRKVSEGVRFVVSFQAPNQPKQRLFDKTLVPRNGPDYAGPVQFSLNIPESGTLYLETEPVGNTSYDWSMWRGLNIVPQRRP